MHLRPMDAPSCEHLRGSSNLRTQTSSNAGTARVSQLEFRVQQHHQSQAAPTSSSATIAHAITRARTQQTCHSRIRGSGHQLQRREARVRDNTVTIYQTACARHLEQQVVPINGEHIGAGRAPMIFCVHVPKDVVPNPGSEQMFVLNESDSVLDSKTAVVAFQQMPT